MDRRFTPRMDDLESRRLLSDDLAMAPPGPSPPPAPYYNLEPRTTASDAPPQTMQQGVQAQLPPFLLQPGDSDLPANQYDDLYMQTLAGAATQAGIAAATAAAGRMTTGVGPSNPVMGAIDHGSGTDNGDGTNSADMPGDMPNGVDAFMPPDDPGT